MPNVPKATSVHPWPASPRPGLAIRYYPQYVHPTPNLHAVDFVLLQIVLKGRCMHIMGEDRHDDDGPGAMGIIHYDQVHDLVTPYGPVDVVNIFVDLRRYPLPELPAELQPVLPVIVPLHPSLGHRLNRMVHLQLPDPEAAFDLLWGMLREQEGKSPGAAAAMDAYFRLFLMLCCRAALAAELRPAPPSGLHAASRLEEVRHYIDTHFREPLSIDMLVKVAGMSRSHLCRTFTQYAGVPLMTYVMQRRQEQVMLRLRSGDEKIATIALDCGFGDISFFNRSFKRSTGFSPSDYRRRMQAIGLKSS